MIESTGGERGITTPRRTARVRAAVLAMIGVCATTAPSTPRAAEHPSVLLITVDTLRADHLGAYGYPHATSRRIDRLAAKGVRFADCTVPWPKTQQSMAALHTGAYPKTTGMRTMRQRLPPEWPVLSEVFRENGYATAAVVANFNIGRAFGFERGFDDFVESWEERWREEAGTAPFRNTPGRAKRYTDARLVTDQALRWLAARDADRPYFLWLHYMDPHGPYAPAARYAERFRDAHAPEPVPVDRLPAYQRLPDLDRSRDLTDLGPYRARYDGEIRYLDDEIARLIDSTRPLRDTALIFTADHGESLGEHDYYLGHGRFPYQECAQVPLFFVAPGRLPRQKVVAHPVGLIDLSPTILELAGLPIPSSFEGTSLLGIARDEPGSSPPEHVFMESGRNAAQSQVTIRHGRWKLVHVRSEADRRAMVGGAHELYDLGADPRELRDVSGDRPDVVGRLSEALDRWYASGAASATASHAVPLEKLQPRAIEMLRSLGYIGGDSDEER